MFPGAGRLTELEAIVWSHMAVSIDDHVTELRRLSEQAARRSRTIRR